MALLEINMGDAGVITDVLIGHEQISQIGLGQPQSIGSRQSLLVSLPPVSTRSSACQVHDLFETAGYGRDGKGASFIRRDRRGLFDQEHRPVLLKRP